MKFEYTFRNTPADFFWFRLGTAYSQWTAVVNVIFTFAFIALAVSRWGSTNLLGRILVIIGILIFPVFQPLAMYLNGMKDASAIKVDTTVSFDNSGMHITVQDHRQTIRWKNFQSVVKRNKMLIMLPDGQHAYLLTNRIVGEEKEALYAFCTSKIKK